MTHPEYNAGYVMGCAAWADADKDSDEAPDDLALLLPPELQDGFRDGWRETAAGWRKLMTEPAA